MSFKNALKNLIAHFGVVWALLLYIVIFAALIIGLSLPFIMPIARALDKAGVFTHLGEAFSSLFGDGGFGGLWSGLSAAYSAAGGVFAANDSLASLSIAFIIIVVVFAFRFFLGLYEIPMATVLDGRLSCNAHYGLGGKFFSTLWLSVRYSFAKMLFTTLFDSVVFAILYGLGQAFGMGIVTVIMSMLVLLVLGALRFSVSASWAPCVVNGDCGVAKGFFRSAKLCFKNFATFYSTYFMSLLIITALGVFITVFTLGVGLIIVLPVSAAYISYLNTTEYYNKTGKRYYVDGIVVTPPMRATD